MIHYLLLHCLYLFEDTIVFICSMFERRVMVKVDQVTKFEVVVCQMSEKNLNRSVQFQDNLNILKLGCSLSRKNYGRSRISKLVENKKDRMKLKKDQG